MEAVFREVEDIRFVEQAVEELEDLVLGEAGNVVLGRLEAALGAGPVLVEAARPFEPLQDRQTQAAFFSSSGAWKALGIRWSRVRSPARPQVTQRWKSLCSFTYSRIESQAISTD